MNIHNIFSVALLVLSASCGNGNEASDSQHTATDGRNEFAGKKIFINNCIQCHDVSRDKNGPALAGTMQRWDNDTARLIAYIRNSQQVIAQDAYAAKLFKEWSNMVMPSFPHLSDAEIKDILEYIGKD